MAARDLGKELEKAGWQQGVLLPAQSSAVLFHLDEPLTKIARRAKSEAEAEYQSKTAPGKVPPPRHAIGHGASHKAGDQLVVISQTCDIVKSQTVEPVVWAIRAFKTDNSAVLKQAGGNSKRQFLLDESRGLVVEMSDMTAIEKPVLIELTPSVGAPDEATRRRFANWLADRFSRVPQDTPVVKAVIKPILDNLRNLQSQNDPDLWVLEHLQEVRFGRLQGMPPYNVLLLFMLKNSLSPDGELALARLIGHMRQWLANQGQAELVAADTATPADITLENYLSTDKLDLDEYTYRGRTVQGLVPIAHL